MKNKIIATLIILCLFWSTGCSQTTSTDHPPASSLAKETQATSSSAPSSQNTPSLTESTPSSAQEPSAPQDTDFIPMESTFDYFETHEYKEGTSGASIQYLFHQPARESTQPLPLVIFLHGKGDAVSIDYCGTAGPIVDGLMKLENQSEQYATYTLVPITPHYYEGDWQYAQIEAFKTLLPKIVEQYNIDPMRIYLSGISMGGFMTCRLVSEMPGFFAAAVPLSGSLLIDFPDQNLGTAFRIYHVATDEVVVVTCSRQLHEQLLNANHPNLQYIEYPTGDHISPLFTVFEEEGKEFFDWLFAQRLHPEYNTIEEYP